jgi:hypothetical protein
MLKYRVEQNTTNLAGAHRQVQELEAAVARRIDTRGDQFRMQIGNQSYTDRGDAARGLVDRLADVLNAPYGSRGEHPVGELGGYPLVAQRQYRDSEPITVLRFVDAPAAPVVVSVNDTEHPAAGLVVRFENVLRTFERRLASTHERIEELTSETARAQAKLGQPFKYRDELHAAYATRKAINADLAQATDPPARPAAADPDVAASLALLGATHAGQATGQRSGQADPSGARPYRPAVGEHDPTVTLD